MPPLRTFSFVQYDLFVINLVLRLLRNEYPEYSDSAGVNIRALEGSVAAAALVGAIIGQLVAGSRIQYYSLLKKKKTVVDFQGSLP
jgi:hypothetical protein